MSACRQKPANPIPNGQREWAVVGRGRAPYLQEGVLGQLAITTELARPERERAGVGDWYSEHKAQGELSKAMANLSLGMVASPFSQ